MLGWAWREGHRSGGGSTQKGAVVRMWELWVGKRTSEEGCGRRGCSERICGRRDGCRVTGGGGTKKLWTEVMSWAVEGWVEPLGLGCRLVATKEAERELGPLFSRPLGVHFFLQGSAGPSISPLYSVPVEGESSIGSKLPRNPPEQPRYGSQLQKDVSFTVCPIRASPGARACEYVGRGCGG